MIAHQPLLHRVFPWAWMLLLWAAAGTLAGAIGLKGSPSVSHLLLALGLGLVGQHLLQRRALRGAWAAAACGAGLFVGMLAVLPERAAVLNQPITWLIAAWAAGASGIRVRMQPWLDTADDHDAPAFQRMSRHVRRGIFTLYLGLLVALGFHGVPDGYGCLFLGFWVIAPALEWLLRPAPHADPAMVQASWLTWALSSLLLIVASNLVVIFT